ncbi:MAG: hypothetical protein MK226_07380 [Saprospiraceae bacterium]|nr:hypothetical protein [Saprospiraceae bacterium]
MVRVSKVLLFILTFQLGFSQSKKFEKFVDELNNFRTDSNSITLQDSTIRLEGYTLKWTHLKGTYGGSPYGGKGKVFEGSSYNDSLLDQSYLALSAPLTKILMIGDKYIVAEDEYPEPQPTSNVHFVYVIRYYIIEEKETVPNKK